MKDRIYNLGTITKDVYQYVCAMKIVPWLQMQDNTFCLQLLTELPGSH